MSIELAERSLRINGIQMHIAEQGQGPLVVLCHGWPALGRSWRHHLRARRAAFHAVSPDMRGLCANSMAAALAQELHVAPARTRLFQLRALRRALDRLRARHGRRRSTRRAHVHRHRTGR
jgi:pimeloyl-ACP methyl ester carboxylesterase